MTASYRANQWLWWRISVAAYRAEWLASRQAALAADLTEVIGLLAGLMGVAR